MLYYNSVYTGLFTTPLRIPALPNALHSTPRSHAVPIHMPIPLSAAQTLRALLCSGHSAGRCVSQ